MIFSSSSRAALCTTALSLLAFCAVEASAKKAESAGTKKQANELVVTYTQTGGFVATHKTSTVHESSLNSAELKSLTKAIDKSGILKITNVQKMNPAAADVFYYDFLVESCGKKHHASYDDTTLPKSYSELRDFMSDRAKPTKPTKP